MNEAEVKIKRALIGVMQTDPFFASILIRQDFNQSTAIPTICTNGKEIVYNPQFVAERSRQELEIILVHEAAHHAFGHTTRFDQTVDKMAYDFNVKNKTRFSNDEMKAMFSKAFNIAGDLAINSMLYTRTGFPILEACVPRVGEFGDYLVGESTEAYFIKIVQNEVNKNQQAVKAAREQAEKAKAEGSSSSPKKEPEKEEQKSTEVAPEKKEEKQKPAVTKPALKKEEKQNVFGEMKQCPTPEGDAEAEQERLQSINTALTVARSAGDLPEWVEKMVEKQFEAVELDWKVLLRSHVSKTIHRRISYRRPNRRYGQDVDGFIMPAKYNKTLGSMMFVGDQSGSMPDASVYLAYEQMDCIASEFKQVEVDFMAFNTGICFRKTLGAWDFPMTKKAKSRYGSGGTAICPVISEINRTQPLIAVILTDLGFGDWETFKQTKCRVPIIWLVPERIDKHPDYESKFTKHKEMLPYGQIARLECDFNYKPWEDKPCVEV